MEVTLDNVLEIIDFQEKVSIVIQKRLDEFYSRYGREETLNAIGTIYCSSEEIIFSKEGDLKWQGSSPDGYRDEYYSFPSEYIEDEVWNKYLNNYQKVIDERLNQRKEQSIFELKKVIAQREAELQRLKDRLDMETNL